MNFDETRVEESYMIFVVKICEPLGGGRRMEMTRKMRYVESKKEGIVDKFLENLRTFSIKFKKII